MTLRVVQPTSPADLRDQHWLDEQIATLGDGIEAARDIWLNWSDIRCVGRFYPGMTAGDFIASKVGGLRLDVGELVKALPDMSGRELAKVAGVSEATVRRERGASNDAPTEPPARVVGADGKSYPGRVVREVVAEVIEQEPINFRVLSQTFERDAGRLLEGYRVHMSDPRFADRYGAVMAAIEAALSRRS